MAESAFIIKEMDRKTINRLAKKGCLMEVAAAIEKTKMLLLNIDINLTARNYPNRSNRIWEKFVTCIGGIVEQEIEKIPSSVKTNLIRNIHRRFVVIEKFLKRHIKLSREKNLLMKGEHIREILAHYHYNLTLGQLLSIIEKFQLNKKDIEKLCNMAVIYQQEQNGTILYAKSKNRFEHNWDSQVEYFNELFNRSGFTTTKRLISYLDKSALSEKGWQLDEMYVSLLISKVLQIPANAYENITEKKRKDKLDPKDNVCLEIEK